MPQDRRHAIRTFMRQRELKVAPWTSAAKIRESTLRDYLSGRNKTMTVETLDKLAAAADATLGEMIGEKPRDGRIAKDVIAIKSLDVRASMGGGFEVNDEPEAPPYFFRRDLIAKILDKQSGRLRVIDLGGDSMRPTISDGDKGLVNLDAPFETGRIYTIWDGRGLMVKRVELMPSHVKPILRIVSDNSAISEPYTVDAEDVRIVGRVVWRGGYV